MLAQAITNSRSKLLQHHSLASPRKRRTKSSRSNGRRITLKQEDKTKMNEEKPEPESLRSEILFLWSPNTET